MFKVGDKVYHDEYGWGVIQEIVGTQALVKYTREKLIGDQILSFTEYTLEVFSQERPIPLGVPIPLKVENVDIKKLWNTCEDFISFLDSDEYHEDKIENYVNDIFWKAMESIYGKEVFNFINNRIE